jgi:ribulose-phosphate 3-epimerase
MQQVIPAIIPLDLDSLAETLALIKPITRDVQVDIVDGKFVPFTSWPYFDQAHAQMPDFRECTEGFDVEVDLMLVHPELVLDRWITAGAKKIVVHLEGVKDIGAIFAHRASHDYQLGFSILNTTPLETLLRYIDRIDYVQLMGIREIGSQGQPFDESVISRVRTLRMQYPDLLISIDGSVNEETLPRLRAAGANRFVSGSAILKADDMYAAYQKLTELASV